MKEERGERGKGTDGGEEGRKGERNALTEERKRKHVQYGGVKL